MQADTIHILASINKAFTLPLAVTMRSLLSQLAAQSRVQLYVLSADLDEVSKASLAKAWEGFPITVSYLEPGQIDWAGQVRYNGHAGDLSAYLRLLLGELLPQTLDRVLYLDSDILVLGDITPLWNERLDGHVVAAVQQPTLHTMQAAHGLALCTELGLHDKQPMLNSGVMLIDLAKWRAQDLGSKAIALAQRYKNRFIYHDQDPLNVVLAGKWKALPPKWNAQTQLAYMSPRAVYTPETFREALKNPVIVHYTCAVKPWHAHSQHPFTAHWRKVYSTIDARPLPETSKQGMSAYRTGMYYGYLALWVCRSLLRSNVPFATAFAAYPCFMLRHPLASAGALYDQLRKRVRGQVTRSA
jgi:lipopolysaccharide biosynthesis glycosyltransferase